MKQTALITLLMSLLSLAMALCSIGMSPDFTIDTVDPQIEFINPTGGEIWYIGDSHDLQWLATDTNLGADAIDIWYSLDGGASHTPLASSITGSGIINWEIPAHQTTNARIRIKATDEFGNSKLQSSSSFTISYVPPATPTGLTIDITDGINAAISWDAVTHTIAPYDTPITPDGYLILYNESPYEHDEHFYYFLGHSFTTDFTHHYVTAFRDQMYYRVIAYKIYRGEDGSSLERLIEESKSRPIPWPEAKNILSGGEK